MYVQPHHQRVVAGTAATLSWQQIGGDGEPADPGVVTVTVSRAAGTVLATAAVTGGTDTEARTYALTASQTATLDRLTVTWVASGVTLATTEVDVCAAPWFSNAELRAAHRSLTPALQYPAALITVARLQVEGFIERVTGRRFVPGYEYVTIPGASGRQLVLPNVDVRSVRTAVLLDDPAAAAVETLATGELVAIPPAPNGVITRYAGTWCARWVRIGYEYGKVTPPGDVKAAAMRLCREVLERSKVVAPDQAITWNSTDFGWSAVMVTPGVRGAHTSLPTVNEVLDEWTFAQVAIA